MTNRTNRTPAALRRFQDRMTALIGVVLLFMLCSTAFVYVTCDRANSEASLLTGALRRAQCEDAAAAWRDLGVTPFIALALFVVILALRAWRDRRDASAPRL